MDSLDVTQVQKQLTVTPAGSLAAHGKVCTIHPKLSPLSMQEQIQAKLKAKMQPAAKKSAEKKEKKDKTGEMHQHVDAFMRCLVAVPCLGTSLERASEYHAPVSAVLIGYR